MVVAAIVFVVVFVVVFVAVVVVVETIWELAAAVVHDAGRCIGYYCLVTRRSRCGAPQNLDWTCHWA